MRILTLESENFKRLKVVEITPDGNMVKITGRNAQGKTSVLDALFSAIAGASASPKVPINDSATEARIRLTMGNRNAGGPSEVELIVTRKFKRDSSKDKGYTTSLKVEGNTPGMAPQDYLDSLLSVLTFDPLDFMRMKPKEQFDLFRRFVPDVNFDAIDAQNQIDYSTRTELNRKAEAAKAAAGKIVVPSGIPDTRIDETALVAELANAAQVNAGILARQSNREKLRSEVAARQRKIVELKSTIAGLEASIAADEQRLASAPPLPDLADVADLQERIAAAKTVNAGIEQRELRDKYTAMAADLSTQSDALTKAMQGRQVSVTQAIAKSKLPVPDVTFGDGQILYKGLPLSQASDAEQIRISAEVAMADNPKLKVIRIRQGSLIDSDGMKVLSEIAKERDFDVWIEIVDSTGKVGFVLEDGMARKADETPDITPTQPAGDTPYPFGKKTNAAPSQNDLPLDVL